jgi:hypothetical protein
MNTKLKLCTEYLRPFNMTKKNPYDAPLKQSFIHVYKHMAYAWCGISYLGFPREKGS